MFTAKKVYAMLENESLWQTAVQCHQLLAAAKIPHAIIGGVAVCLHGYQRNTVFVNFLIRQDDYNPIRDVLDAEGFDWHPRLREYRTADGAPIQFHIAGEPFNFNSQVMLPDPGAAKVTTMIEGLPVVMLPKLIEMKIACGLSSMRRMHKDFADVVELIVQNRLNNSFARFLHKSLRATYRDLIKRSKG